MHQGVAGICRRVCRVANHEVRDSWRGLRLHHESLRHATLQRGNTIDANLQRQNIIYIHVICRHGKRRRCDRSRIKRQYREIVGTVDRDRHQLRSAVNRTYREAVRQRFRCAKPLNDRRGIAKYVRPHTSRSHRVGAIGRARGRGNGLEQVRRVVDIRRRQRAAHRVHRRVFGNRADRRATNHRRIVRAVDRHRHQLRGAVDRANREAVRQRGAAGVEGVDRRVRVVQRVRPHARRRHRERAIAIRRHRR